jgi:raffinose/stachyose/melibiose transport system permease protein
MVQSRKRRIAYFWAFVIPALFLYGLFFIYPFTQGIRISFTNWDGLSQKSPISLPKEEFERTILDKVKKAADRDFLLSLYSYNDKEGIYGRESLGGWKRVRVEAILSSVKYQSPGFRDVGFKNYADIFGANLDARFYPRIITAHLFSVDGQLSDIQRDGLKKRAFESNFLSRLGKGERKTALRFFSLGKDGYYALADEYEEPSIKDLIWLIPEVDKEGRIEASAVEELISGIEAAALAEDSGALRSLADSFKAGNALSADSAAKVDEASARLFAIGGIKKTLALKWKASSLDLGVVGFTLFFTVFSVIIGNIFAFGLAMALDTKIHSKNVLRSVFFLPNILSMIVVALIWSFVFAKLLPKLTGIETWMGDPGKTPWLIVMVAVWQAAGYYMVIYLAGLQNIPTEVMEAATIDGANWWQRLRHIVLPLLMPAFTICLFLSTANALKCFDLVYAMVGPSGYNFGTAPLVMDIFFDAFARKMAGLATAKAIILFAVIFLITGIQLRVMGKKEVRL